MAIKAGRNTCRYAVAETATDEDGRAFKLDKMDKGSDPEVSTYAVFVCRAGQDHRCDRKGFLNGNGKPCRHVNALKALTAAARGPPPSPRPGDTAMCGQTAFESDGWQVEEAAMEDIRRAVEEADAQRSRPSSLRASCSRLSS